MAQKNVLLLDDTARVYSDTVVTSPVVVVLNRNQDFSLGKTLNVAGVTWCEVTLPDGRTGYVAGSTRVAVKTITNPRASSVLAVVFLVIGVGLGIWVVSLPFALLLDYISAQKSDELSKDGGHNRVYDWLVKDGLMDTLAQGKAPPFTRCAPISGRQTFEPFVVWAFGDDYRDYSGTQVGSGALGFEDFPASASVDTFTWGHTNSVLIVKLTGAGSETRPVSQPTKNTPAFPDPQSYPEHQSYKDEQIKVYNAEAWLVDKQTRQCLGHKTFQPGPDPDSASVSPFIPNPFVKYYSVNDLRFRAIAHAVEWAKSPQ